MGLKIDAKDFLTNMSAIKQRSMFAAEKVGQNAAARMEGEPSATPDGQTGRGLRARPSPDTRLAGEEAAHGHIRQHGIQRVSGAGA